MIGVAVAVALLTVVLAVALRHADRWAPPPPPPPLDVFPELLSFARAAAQGVEAFRRASADLTRLVTQVGVSFADVADSFAISQHRPVTVDVAPGHTGQVCAVCTGHPRHPCGPVRAARARIAERAEQRKAETVGAVR